MRAHAAASVGAAVYAFVLVGTPPVHAQAPDHPVITEVFQEPPATGGPAVRDPADPHQEYIEIYIPPLGDLDPALDANSLDLAFYEVEGDATSPGLSLVNYRIDLPTFDLDPSDGLTGLPRPASGVVVLGWVDYVGAPPTDLAGTPSSRVALIDGGVTSVSGFTFVAINGSQFSGTTNFPVPIAVSHIDTVSDPVTGKIEQGSGVYLLMNRDHVSYVEVCGQTDPAPCNAFPNLAAGSPLSPAALLDAFAANDDSEFRVDRQPYEAPTGDNIDLEFVLPLGGAFSLLAPQVPEETNGYQRLFVDVPKTTEDGNPGNDDPVSDAQLAYRDVSNLGPFVPTPGRATQTTSAAVLSLADSSLQTFELLPGTRARPGLLAANLGGDFGVNTLSLPGLEANSTKVNLSPAASSSPALGQSAIAPELEAVTSLTAEAGYVDIVDMHVTASKALPADPAVEDPVGVVDATFTVIDPTTGLDAGGAAFEATSFLAVLGVQDQVGVANELLTTSLGARMSQGLFFDSAGNGAALVDPLTDLSDPLVVDPMIKTMPTDPAEFINRPSPTGTLVAEVLGSAESTLSGTYDDSFNGTQTLVQAREFLISEAPTRASSYVPTEPVHYADAKGLPGSPNSGLTNALTSHGFELAIIDTNLGPTGAVETGATDDFGIVVQVGQTSPTATVVPGELVFLSFTGGFEGADIDTLDVPPHGNLLTISLVDLDPLYDVLGAETITRVFVVDGSGNGEIDVLDVITLPEPSPALALPAAVAFLVWLARRRGYST